MVVLDYEKAISKKPSKTMFLPPPSRGQRRERPQVQKHTLLTLLLWGLEDGQEVVSPFCGPQNFIFNNLLKPHVFKAFPGKLAVAVLGRERLG